jgi:CheY-like chemotaxis protein
MKPVLVVDDEREIREAISEILREEGYDVVAAADGREALLRLREFHPSLVLLDLMMPGMNGWEFRAEQMGDPSVSSIPVIIVSALGNDTSLRAQSTIEKPFDLGHLLSEVKRLAIPV